MKITELRKKSREELETLLKEKRREQNELYFLLHQKKIKNVKEGRNIRKDIARILTIVKQ
ncbi:MAG: hypothetical protein G01um101433_777 [Parcubacteria group bacterium Gr01-1014_33]|nr:MAG: hypothetical protein G01um101433_777 [Parcubacteria group bacterium Gr01-1014_33]